MSSRAGGSGGGTAVYSSRTLLMVEGRARLVFIFFFIISSLQVCAVCNMQSKFWRVLISTCKVTKEVTCFCTVQVCFLAMFGEIIDFLFAHEIITLVAYMLPTILT